MGNVFPGQAISNMGAILSPQRFFVNKVSLFLLRCANYENAKLTAKGHQTVNDITNRFSERDYRLLIESSASKVQYLSILG
jgi:hypothetical protein